MRNKVAPPEREVARIAARQHGVITIHQLLAAGLTRQGVTRRVRRGTLHREFRGVYRVGHRAPSVEARYMAAVLACGDGAVLSGLAAAYFYGLIRRSSPPPPEVTASAVRRVDGVITRRTRNLDRRDTTLHRLVPIRTAPRTLVDLAATLSPDDLALAAHEAEVKYRVNAKKLYAALARRPKAPGAWKLHGIFHGQRIKLSELERLFVELLRSAGLPLPLTNRPAGGRYVDCRWPDHKLTVELLSYRYHHTRHAWEQDHRRKREARKRGDAFRTYTWDDVTEHREETLEELRELPATAAASTRSA
jgi:putative AbiEi antitoxin of type IV toxin-antitoxin system